ncbi:hypothetical protein ACWCYZ_16890 [Streptomyces virginiae]|uniref:hypothetical protein n=1 Tax=Streptomyces virginiae TaxID=1961 RepID=UPI00365CBFD3
MTAPFSRAQAAQRLGPEAAQAIRELAAAAPPLSTEMRMQIQAVFASASPATTRPPMPAAA